MTMFPQPIGSMIVSRSEPTIIASRLATFLKIFPSLLEELGNILFP